MVVMPMFHINAQVISVLATRLSGGKLVIAPKFSASGFWPTIETNHVTWVSVVPTIISILLMNQQALAAYHSNIHLRFVRSSSFALPEDKLVAFQSHFHTQVLEGYGMTETASQSTLNPIHAPKIGSAGKPVGTELRIKLADGTFTKKPFVEGEIVLRGDHVIHDYLEPHPESFENGWFLTGDLGYLDQDGYLFVKGRRKEMINRGGEKVAPANEMFLTNWTGLPKWRLSAYRIIYMVKRSQPLSFAKMPRKTRKRPSLIYSILPVDI